MPFWLRKFRSIKGSSLGPFRGEMFLALESQWSCSIQLKAVASCSSGEDKVVEHWKALFNLSMVNQDNNTLMLPDIRKVKIPSSLLNKLIVQGILCSIFPLSKMFELTLVYDPENNPRFSSANCDILWRYLLSILRSLEATPIFHICFWP